MASSRPVLPRPGDCAEADFARPSRPQGQQDLAEHHDIIRNALLRSRRDTHQRIQSLREARKPLTVIAQEVGLDQRTVGEWFEATAPPTRRPKAMAPRSPNYFHEYLARRWSEGRVRGRDLFDEIKLQRYTGSYSHLERLLSTWRTVRSVAPEHLRTAETHHLVDPATGNVIAPNIAAILCMKPRGQLTAKQAANVDAMKAASSEPDSHFRMIADGHCQCDRATCSTFDQWELSRVSFPSSLPSEISSSHLTQNAPHSAYLFIACGQ